MHGWHCGYVKRRRQEAAAIAKDANRLAEDSLDRCGSQAYEQPGPNCVDFGAQPRRAGGDVADVRLLLKAALAALTRTRSATVPGAP